jgi:hypothetical protein
MPVSEITTPLEEVRQVPAADLLLALDDEGEITRQFRPGAQIGFDRLEVGEVLALVVARAPAEKRAALDRGLERFGLPQLERLRRLHVVVAIDEIMRLAAALIARRAGNQHGIARRGDEPRVEAEGAAMPEQPLGVREQVALVRRLRRDARETGVLDQFVNEASLVAREIIEDRLHRARSMKHKGERRNTNSNQPATV